MEGSSRRKVLSRVFGTRLPRRFGVDTKVQVKAIKEYNFLSTDYMTSIILP